MTVPQGASTRAGSTTSTLGSSQTRTEDGQIIDTEIADAIVRDPAALVSSARRQNQSVYCWVA
ncbi:hypothetical protein [Streptomyces sp. NPDC054874]